jgi:hypothetical protein
MVYREPDPERAHEAEDDEENREALERLAQAGMRKQQALAQAHADAQLLAATRTTSKRFRARALRGPRYVAFVGFWVVVVACLSILTGLANLAVTGDFGRAFAVTSIAFVAYNASALAAIPPMILFGIWSAIWKRRDARELLAWNARLPFPFARFEPTLSLDHTLSVVRVTVWFVGNAPPQDLVVGLRGNLVQSENTSTQIGKRAIAFFCSSLEDGDFSRVVAFVRDLTEKVLLPLHAVHTIEVAALDEGDERQTWDFGDAAKALKESLDQRATML